MCSTLPSIGLKMRLMMLMVACAEAGSNRRTTLLHTSRPLSKGVLLHNRPRLPSAHAETHIQVLSESLRRWSTAGLGLDNRCCRLPSFAPFQLLAAAPLFEARLVGETLWDDNLSHQRIGRHVCAVDSGSLPPGTPGRRLSWEVAGSNPPTRSASLPPASATDWA